MKKIIMILALAAIHLPSIAQQQPPQQQPKMYTVQGTLEFWQGTINLVKTSKANYETTVAWMDYITAQIIPQLPPPAKDTTSKTGDSVNIKQSTNVNKSSVPRKSKSHK